MWARSEVSDTNRYVDTITPLASDPGVQATVTDNVTNQVIAYLNIEGITNQVFSQLGSKGILPPALAAQLQALAGPVSNGIEGFIHTQVGKFVASPAFQTAWIDANRVAHQQLVAVLSGDNSGAVSTTNGKISVNLATVINAVKAQLVASGFSIASNIPTVNATFTIFEDPNISKVQTAYSLLDKLGLWLPFIALILFGIGIYVARNHRRAFMAAGITTFIAAVLLAIGLAFGRHVYLNALSSDVLPRNVAATIFDTVVAFLRNGIRSVAIVGFVVAVGAFLVGPSVTATKARQITDQAAGGIKGGVERLGLHLDPVTRWVAANVRWLRWLICLGAAVILLFWPYRTPTVTVWFVVITLVLLFILQVLASPPTVREPDEVLVVEA